VMLVPFMTPHVRECIDPVLTFPWPQGWRHICGNCREEIYVRAVTSVAEQMPKKAEHLQAIKSMVELRDSVNG
jgi:hypothetical protein